MAQNLLNPHHGMVERILRSQAGFTLLELVMTLLILGILMALALPNYLHARRKAYFSEAGERLQEMRETAWAHYLAHGTFTGFPNQPSPPTRYWTFAYGPCQDVACTMTASGKAATPVEGAAITLVLSGDGQAEVTWTGF